MEIKKAVNNDELVLSLVGRLDTNTSPMLEEEIGTLGVYNKLVLDFKELQYISSAGLRVLLKFHKAMNAHGEMILKNVNEDILEIFNITGFSDILTIE